MADLTVKQKQIFDNYKKTHPKMSDEEILSVLVKTGDIKLTEDQQASLFFHSQKGSVNGGLNLEHSEGPAIISEETVFLQSGKKVVIVKKEDGKTYYRYYAADGKSLNPDIFKQQEGVISVSPNRKTYTVTKNGKSVIKKTKDPLTVKLDQQQAALNKTKKEQGFLGKAWDWFKNATDGFLPVDSSNKAQKQIDAERRLAKQIESGKVDKKQFKEITGKEYSAENLQKFKNGELELLSEEKVKGYQEGQEMAVDTIGDIFSGIAAVGLYTAAIAAAPVTGGLSLAVGFGVAAATGAGIKAGIKYADAKSAGREYTTAWHDIATGAISGALGPLTGGIGGAVGKTTAIKVLGIQAFKTVGKETVEAFAETGLKQAFKTGLRNPYGYKYVGGSSAKRAAAFVAETCTDGALGGALDTGFREGYDNNWDVGAMLQGTWDGFKGGLLMAPALGGSFKLVGKGGQKLGLKLRGKGKNDGVNNTGEKALPPGPHGEGVNEGVNGVGENPATKELSAGADDTTPAPKAEDGNKEKPVDKRCPKVLEGGILDTELDEVAPFAKRLEKSPEFGDDMVYPDRSSGEMHNATVKDGEIVPDRTVTKYEEKNNPLNKKSRTYLDNFNQDKVALTKDELTEQIKHHAKDMYWEGFDGKLKEFLDENPDIEISDISVMLYDMDQIGILKELIRYDYNINFSKISDFTKLKDNMEILKNFHQKSGNSYGEYRHSICDKCNLANSKFMEYFSGIEPKILQENLDGYSNMSWAMQNSLSEKNMQKFLSESHSPKYFERLQKIDEFNKNENLYDRRFYGKPYLAAIANKELLEDANWEILSEKLNYCSKYHIRDSFFRSRLLENDSENKLLNFFRQYEKDIPEYLQQEAFKVYKNCSDYNDFPSNPGEYIGKGKLDEFAEFCRKMPKEYILKMFETDSNGALGGKDVFQCFYAVHDDVKYLEPEKILKNIKLIEAVAPAFSDQYKNGLTNLSHWQISNILLKDMNFKDYDKAVEFLNNVDKNSFRRVCDKNPDKITQFVNNLDNIDGAISNSKMFNELPDDIKKQISPYLCQTDNIYNINSKDFKARVEILQKYGKFLDKNLNQGSDYLSILTGNCCSDIRIYKMFSELPESARKSFRGLHRIDGIETLSDEAIEKMAKVFKNTKDPYKKYESKIFDGYEIRGVFAKNLHLWEELSYEELSTIPFKNFTNGPYRVASTDVIKQRIALIPEKLRSVFKDIDTTELVDELSFWFNPKEDSSKKLIEAMQRLEKLDKEDINNLGAKTIQEFLEKSRYSEVDLNISPDKLAQLRQLPKGALELLKSKGSRMLNLLTKDGSLDCKTITERYNLLVSKNLDSKIDSDHFYRFLYAESEQYSIVKTILDNPNREISDINSLINSLPESASIKKHHDYIFNTLINNPKNKTEDISTQLSYIFRQDDFCNSHANDSEKLLYEKQREFSKKVVSDLIKRGESENDDNLLRKIISVIKEYEPKNFSKEKAKYESIMKLIDSEKYTNEEIINLYGCLRNKIESYQKQINIIEILIKEKRLSSSNIQQILDTINNENISLAERLCTDTKLNFPREMIADILKNANKNNISLAERLCTDKNLDFPKEKIANILQYTKKENISLAEHLCTDKALNFPKELISDILGSTNENNISLAERLCTDKKLNFPKDKIKDLLKNTNDTNTSLILTLIESNSLPIEHLIKFANFSSNKMKFDIAEEMVSSAEYISWITKNLDEDQDFATLEGLFRTQKKISKDKQNISKNKTEKPKSTPKTETTTGIVEQWALDRITTFGIDEKLAKGFLKKVQINGRVDNLKLETLEKLFSVCKDKKEMAGLIKDFDFIFDCAIGNELSTQNSKFRVELIDDIVKLKKCGFSFKYATNLSSVKNMDYPEMKVRIKEDKRKELVDKVTAILNSENGANLRTQLEKEGFDIDEILSIAKSEPKTKGKTLKGAEDGLKVKLRKLDELHGAERILAYKYKDKIPTETWANPEAFKKWAKEQFDNLCDWEKNPQFHAKGQFESYNQARKDGIEAWRKYLTEDSDYTDDPFVHLLVMSEVTKSMKPENAHTPKNVNAEIFNQTYNALLDADGNSFNFDKIYAKTAKDKAISKYYTDIVEKDGVEQGRWVKIPCSQKGDTDYDLHISMIQGLAEGSSWCLKHDNAHGYHQQGDIWFYVDANGNSQTAITVDSKGTILHIEKRYNEDGTAPIPYIDEIIAWRDKYKFNGKEDVLNNAKNAKPDFDKQKEKLTRLIEEADNLAKKEGSIPNYEAVFKELGIKVKTAEDGTLILSSYNPFVTKLFTLFDLGINENNLLRNISEISSNVNFNGSAVSELPFLRRIKGALTFGDSKINDLSGLEEINGHKVVWINK